MYNCTQFDVVCSSFFFLFFCFLFFFLPFSRLVAVHIALISGLSHIILPKQPAGSASLFSLAIFSLQKKTDRPVLIYFEFVVCWWPRNSSPEHSSTTASRASPNATAIGVWRSKTASRAGPWPSFTTSTLPYLLSSFLLVLSPKSSIPTFSCAIYNSLLFFWQECVWSPIASSSRVISSLKSAMARDVWGRNRLIPCCYCWALTTCVSMTRAGWKSALRFNTFIYWA